jgi:hypothetical protein
MERARSARAHLESMTIPEQRHEFPAKTALKRGAQLRSARAQPGSIPAEHAARRDRSYSDGEVQQGDLQEYIWYDELDGCARGLVPAPVSWTALLHPPDGSHSNQEW